MMKINIEPIKNNFPYALLMLADPSRAHIDSYLETGHCFGAYLNDEVIGVIVMNVRGKSICEIENIAVDPLFQNNGVGKQLIRFAEEKSNDMTIEKLSIATGNSSIGQLALYQKMGFDICHINYDYFTKNYKDVIVENGIVCKHKIILEKVLNPKN